MEPVIINWLIVDCKQQEAASSACGSELSNDVVLKCGGVGVAAGAAAVW